MARTSADVLGLRPPCWSDVLVLALVLAHACVNSGETITAPPDAAVVRPPPPGANHAVILAKVDAEGTPEMRVKRLLVPETVQAEKAAMMLLDIAPDVQFGGPPHPCYDLLVLVRSGHVEAEVGDARAALSAGDAVTLRRRTPFLLRGAGGETSQLLLVFVPDGMTVAACDELANAGGPVEPLPADPAHPPLQVIHLAEVAPHVIADGHGQARMLLDPQTPAGSTLAYLGELRGDATFSVPEHVHAGAAELLLLVEGRGQLTIGREVIPVSAGMAIYIPPDTPHSFRGEREVEAIQVYAPPGAEDRFRAAPLATP